MKNSNLDIIDFRSISVPFTLKYYALIKGHCALLYGVHFVNIKMGEKNAVFHYRFFMK